VFTVFDTVASQGRKDLLIVSTRSQSISYSRMLLAECRILTRATADAMNTDIISDVLCAVRLKGAIFFEVEATPPWVSEAPHARLIAAQAIPGAQHVIEYHIVTAGSCWGTTVDAANDPVRLGPGSVIVFPHGDPHVLSSKPGMRGPPAIDAFEGRDDETPPYRVILQDDPEPDVSQPGQVRMICGFLGCDLLPFNPLIQALPACVHLPDAYAAEDGWLKSLIDAIIRESAERRPGGTTILGKLSELVFVEVVRRYVELQTAETGGWFTALADPCTGAAIRLIHADPRRAWTLADLAREVGVSRTILIERFNAQLGFPPMTYLSNWRMQIAAGLLTNGSQPLARIADEVGYHSEAAFSRAFKRFTGVPPSEWRNQETTPLAQTN